MKVKGIEGSPEEILEFCKKGETDVTSLVGGTKSTNMNPKYLIASSITYVVSLFLYVAFPQYNLLCLACHISVFVSAILIVIFLILKFRDNKVTVFATLAIIIMYLVITGIYSPKEITEKAEKYYTKHENNNVK